LLDKSPNLKHRRRVANQGEKHCGGRRNPTIVSAADRPAIRGKFVERSLFRSKVSP
jgi:hypothetical protein